MAHLKRERERVNGLFEEHYVESKWLIRRVGLGLGLGLNGAVLAVLYCF